MQELIPVGYGLLLGVALGFLRPSLRLGAGAAFAIALGCLATVITGEFTVSWGYLLVDIPLVGLPAFLGLLSVRRLHPADRSAR